MTRNRRRWAAVALSAALALGAAACGDDDPEAGDDPTPTASGGTPSDSATSAPTQSASPSETASETAAPSVAPATGLVLEEQTSAVNAPAGWEKAEDLVGYASSADAPDGLAYVQLADNHSLAGDSATIDSLFDTWLKQTQKEKGFTYERFADLDLAGTPAYFVQHHVALDGKQQVFEVVALRGERYVNVTIALTEKLLAQQPDLVPSILASFRWLD